MTAVGQVTARPGAGQSARPAGAHLPRRRRGFTLVELMVAIVLVAIVLPTAIQGTILCLDLSVNARMEAQAASLAQAKLSELAATRMIDEATQFGDFGEQWPQYKWMATVESWDDPRLLELDVSVTWVARGRDYDVTISTLIYDGTTGGTIGG